MTGIVGKWADQIGLAVYRNAGSTSASEPGSDASVAWPRTSMETSPRELPSSLLLALCCAPDNLLMDFAVSGRTVGPKAMNDDSRPQCLFAVPPPANPRTIPGARIDG